MEDLRQGQGIIDLVNTYAEVVLFHGLVGLSLFLGFFVTGLFKVYRIAKQKMQSDPDLSLLGLSLVACGLGALVMMISCSFIMGYEKMFYVLAGLFAAYVELGHSGSVPPVHARHVGTRERR